MGNKRKHQEVEMIKLLPKLPLYYLSRQLPINTPMPFSYTFSVTYHCQARCKTCRIYDRDPVQELTAMEWKTIFRGLGKSPYWVTLSGGEPFLNKGIYEIYYYLNEYCSPSIVNIPTNGQMPEVIENNVRVMADTWPRTRLIINLSLDHFADKKNDIIRGVKGYTSNAYDTLHRLIDLSREYDNLEVGIHTVVSDDNVGDLEEISSKLSRLLLEPGNYITEIAENRSELYTCGLGVMPSKVKYQRAINKLIANNYKGLKPVFRRQYYRDVVKWLYTEQGRACFAGYTTCQISPDGDVWQCCMLAEPMGNLRHEGYDFKKIWNSKQARRVRSKNKGCSCPMANVGYTNILMSPAAMISIAAEIIVKWSIKKGGK